MLTRCLAAQHADALFGGDSEPTLWPRVATDDAISARLALLLRELGWHAYLDDDDHTPRWRSIWLSGHSQGGGHAAYLAATVPLAGATLFSAPQDACLGCPHITPRWLQAPWPTEQVHALAHGNESAAATIGENWRRVGVASWATWQRSGAAPREVGLGASHLSPASEASTVAGWEAGWAPWVSWVQPSSLSACHGRPYHCSTAKDATTPLAAAVPLRGQVLALYEIAIWPDLFLRSGGGSDGSSGSRGSGSISGGGGSGGCLPALSEGCVLAYASGFVTLGAMLLLVVACRQCWRSMRRRYGERRAPSSSSSSHDATSSHPTRPVTGSRLRRLGSRRSVPLAKQQGLSEVQIDTSHVVEPAAQGQAGACSDHREP